MNDYLISMQFAECLMKYVVKKQGFDTWKPTKFMSMDNRQNPPLSAYKVGESVLYLMLLRHDIIYRCFDELLYDTFSDAELGRMVNESVPHFFPRGYTHCGFIAFCAMTVGVAANYLNMDNQKLANYMVGLVGNVLSAFILTGEFESMGGWNELEEVSRDFNAGARKRLRRMKDKDFKICSEFVTQKEFNFRETDDSS